VAGFVRRTAIAKGLFGGSRFWMAVLGVIWARRVWRRLAGSTMDPVYREELRPGQALIITHHADQFHGDRMGG
jgi:hypothetical protein